MSNMVCVGGIEHPDVAAVNTKKDRKRIGIFLGKHSSLLLIALMQDCYHVGLHQT